MTQKHLSLSLSLSHTHTHTHSAELGGELMKECHLDEEYNFGFVELVDKEAMQQVLTLLNGKTVLDSVLTG